VQACGSLQEAHHRGLLHRDVKPSNIMLTIKGGVYDTTKILDFGLVLDLAGKDLDDVDESNVIVGTPMYMAPELALSSGSASPAADIYALGAVGYYMLSGTTVFPQGDILEILGRQINDNAPFPSERLGRPLPQDLEYVIMHCLAKNPAERPSSAALLAEMLLACDCGEWTAEDGRHWWEEYGEALREKMTVDQGDLTQLDSTIEVAFDGTAS
jgi:serine/threonine-protein kinase